MKAKLTIKDKFSLQARFRAGNGTVRVVNSDESFDVTAVGGTIVNLPDNVIRLQNTQSVELEVRNVPATEAATLIAPDGNISINGQPTFTVASGGSINEMVENTSGAPVGVFDPNSNSWIVPDGSYEVKDQNNNTLASGSIPSGGFEQINVTIPQDLAITTRVLTGQDFAEWTATANEVGTINTVTTTVLGLVVRRNGAIVTVPFTIANGDLIRFEFTTLVANNTITLEGVY